MQIGKQKSGAKPYIAGFLKKLVNLFVCEININKTLQEGVMHPLILRKKDGKKKK